MSSNKKYNNFCGEQVSEETTARIDFCTVHKRLRFYLTKSSLRSLSCLTWRRNFRPWRRSKRAILLLSSFKVFRNFAFMASKRLRSKGNCPPKLLHYFSVRIRIVKYFVTNLNNHKTQNTSGLLFCWCSIWSEVRPLQKIALQFYKSREHYNSK